MTLLSFLILLIIFIVLGFIIKKWANGPLNPIKKDLTGKLIIVTGSSDGIGLETAKDLLRSNAKVIFACRNKNKTERIINEFPENLKQNSSFVQLDLESFKSIENFAKEIKLKYPKIDILINNAGMSVDKMKKTEDGYIDTYQVNYLGNTLLTLLLFDHFNEKESKIINVSSMGYKFAKVTNGYSKYLNSYDLMYEYYLKTQNRNMILYSDTKLLLIYFTQYIAHLTEEKYQYLKIVCLHPGVIFTNIFKLEKLIHKILFFIFKIFFSLFTKDIVHGAQTTLFLSYSDNKYLVNGGYYNNLKLEKYIPIAIAEKIKNEMINETLNILKDKYKELDYFPLSK